MTFLRIGFTHMFLQAIAAIILTKGAAFLFPLALSELPGQTFFLLWAFLNLVIVGLFLHNLINKLIKKEKYKAMAYLTIVPFIGGIISKYLFILSYIVHFNYINKGFPDHEFKAESTEIGLILILLLFIGEIILLTIKKTTANTVYSK
jgi:hypothetical protein